MIIWQNFGCFTHLPLKVASLLSASLHLLSFHSCFDLHNLARQSQDLLFKFVCTGRSKYKYKKKHQQQFETKSLYGCNEPNASADTLSSAVCSYRQTTRQSEPILYPPYFCCCLQSDVTMLFLEHSMVVSLYMCFMYRAFQGQFFPAQKIINQQIVYYCWFLAFVNIPLLATVCFIIIFFFIVFLLNVYTGLQNPTHYTFRFTLHIHTLTQT